VAREERESRLSLSVSGFPLSPQNQSRNGDYFWFFFSQLSHQGEVQANSSSLSSHHHSSVSEKGTCVPPEGPHTVIIHVGTMDNESGGITHPLSSFPHSSDNCVPSSFFGVMNGERRCLSFSPFFPLHRASSYTMGKASSPQHKNTHPDSSGSAFS